MDLLATFFFTFLAVLIYLSYIVIANARKISREFKKQINEKEVNIMHVKLNYSKEFIS